MRKLICIVLLLSMFYPVFGQVAEAKESEFMATEVVEKKEIVSTSDLIKQKMLERQQQKFERQQKMLEQGIMFYQKAETDTLLYYRPNKAIGVVAIPVWSLSAFLLIDGLRIKTDTNISELKKELKGAKGIRLGASVLFALMGIMIVKVAGIEVPVQYKINDQTHYLTTSFEF